jgi:anti-anti-sigma factor
MERNSFQAVVEITPRYEKVIIRGRLDSQNAEAFEKLLAKILVTKPGNVVLDLEHLEYISSAGLRVITKGIKLAKQFNGKIRLTSLPPQIRKVFDLVGLVPVEQLFPTNEELDAYLNEIQGAADSTAG